MFPKLILVQLNGNKFIVAKYVTDYEDADEQHVPIYEMTDESTSIGVAMRDLDIRKANARRIQTT